MSGVTYVARRGIDISTVLPTIAVLADDTIETISTNPGSEDLTSNGDNLPISGTLTKAAVNTGSGLVEFSGFTTSNYLGQIINENIDPNTKLFSVTCTFSVLNNTTEEVLVDIGDASKSSFRLSVSTAGTLKFTVTDGTTTNQIITSEIYDDGAHYSALCVYKNGEMWLYVEKLLVDYLLGTDITLLTNSLGWAVQTIPVENAWKVVGYGNSLYVALSSDGTGDRVMTSTDGETWTSRVNSIDNNYFNIAYGASIWVALAATGTSNQVMTSADAITWTTRTTPTGTFNWQGLVFGNSLFVAVASSGTANRVMTSTDGITWTQRTSAEDNSWLSIAFGNSTYIAAAIDGTNRIMKSTDGISWTAKTAASADQWRGIAYGNGIWVCVASTGTNRVMTSEDDGDTWTSRASADDDEWWNDVSFGDGIFFAVGNTLSMYSSDGKNWTALAVPNDTTWRDVTYGDSWVAVGNNEAMKIDTNSAKLRIGLNNQDLLPATLSKISNVKVYPSEVTQANLATIIDNESWMYKKYAIFSILGNSYSFDISVSGANESTNMIRNVAKSISGIQNVTYDRTERRHQFTYQHVDRIDGTLSQLLEFFYSMYTGVYATVDKYGSISSPDETMQVTMDSNNYVERRVASGIDKYNISVELIEQ